VSAMKKSELQRLVDAGRRMYQRDLVTGALGSIGARLPSGGVVVTGQGSRLGFLKDFDVVALDGQGLARQETTGVPDGDAGLITAVMSAQPAAGAVIRVQPPYVTALAHRGRRKIEESRGLLQDLGGVAFVPYYRKGTAGLAGAVAGALRENHIAIIERQGPIVRGSDIEDAVDRAEALEAAAKVIFLLSDDNGVL